MANQWFGFGLHLCIVRGVFERDFFQHRGAEEVREVFQKIGVEMPDQAFQEVWQEAQRRDPRGEVRSCTCMY